MLPASAVRLVPASFVRRAADGSRLPSPRLLPQPVRARQERQEEGLRSCGDSPVHRRGARAEGDSGGEVRRRSHRSGEGAEQSGEGVSDGVLRVVACVPIAADEGVLPRSNRLSLSFHRAGRPSLCVRATSRDSEAGQNRGFLIDLPPVRVDPPPQGEGAEEGEEVPAHGQRAVGRGGGLLQLPLHQQRGVAEGAGASLLRQVCHLRVPTAQNRAGHGLLHVRVRMRVRP